MFGCSKLRLWKHLVSLHNIEITEYGRTEQIKLLKLAVDFIVLNTPEFEIFFCGKPCNIYRKER